VCADYKRLKISFDWASFFRTRKFTAKSEKRIYCRGFSEISSNAKWLLVRDGTLGGFYHPIRTRLVGLPLELSAWGQLSVGMSSGELEQIVKDFLEAKFGFAFDYFVIEGRMAPDANGNIGVTGTYRKRTGDKNVFFTVTVNLTSRKIQNLQEY